MLVCRQLYIRAYIANFLKYHRTRERFYISGKIEEKKKERMEEEIKKKILDHLHEFNVTQIINCFLRDSSKYYTKEQDKEEVGKKFCPPFSRSFRNYPDRCPSQIVGRPSEYVKQMLMTTEERTEYIIKWRHKLRLPSCISNENPYFHISPNIVVFQQFTPGVFFSVMVTIRNVTSVIRTFHKIEIRNISRQ